MRIEVMGRDKEGEFKVCMACGSLASVCGFDVLMINQEEAWRIKRKVVAAGLTANDIWGYYHGEGLSICEDGREDDYKGYLCGASAKQ